MPSASTILFLALGLAFAAGGYWMLVQIHVLALMESKGLGSDRGPTWR
jgi:hypothetical protein